MYIPDLLRRLALSFAAIMACVPAAAQNANAPVSLTWVPGSSVKLEQLLGDKDWATGMPTTSQTITRYDVEGTDIGCSFEDQGKLVFLFGDTLGTKVKYQAHDTMAWSTSTDPEAGLLLNFFTNSDGSTLLVEPPGVKMGPFDTPNSGISLPSGTYVVCNTGSDTSLTNVHAHDYSVLTRFDETKGTFSTGRTISRVPGGHFIITSLHLSGTDLLMFGLGGYRATDVYLAVTPASEFESGQGTRYFAGLSHGQPTWTDQETNAVPVVVDNPLNGPAWPNDSPTVGNVSVIYSPDLGLWLMTYDGGRQTEATTGIYFSSAPAPWGPWSVPQLIFNAKRDRGFGLFIHNPNDNPPGPAGPTIGDNDPNTTRGGDYAPQMIERFTKVQGDTLTIYYTMSTWNPYTVVKMRSEFKITR
jgi:Domain of unknown function (DUF4185)